MQDAGYARHFIAVGVHSRNEGGQNLAEAWWFYRDDARQVVVMKLGSQVVLVEGRENPVRKRHSGNQREPHRGLRGRHQFSAIEPRILAGWRIHAFRHPIDKSRLERS